MNSQELEDLLTRLVQDQPSSPTRSGSLPHQPKLIEPTPTKDLDGPSLARFIDHTLLGAHATRDMIRAVCDEASTHGFFSVCIPSSYVSLATSLLHGSRTRVCTVVGFPLGHSTPSTKAFEAREAVRHGASEIDMVLNIAALKSGDYELVTQDIEAVVRAVPGHIVKVILECALLDEQEIIIACALSKGAGAHFVKTSTGFSTSGASTKDVALMRSVVGESMGVKASGGIRTREDAVAMIQAGASRLGCSSSINIITHGDSSDSSDSY